jgi:pimeloyl-ACP methyl ester carboxylesterase
MAAVAREIADSIGSLYAPVTLIGNCSGANIGCFVANLIPDRIARLVTIDAFAFWPWYFSVFVNPFFGRYAYFTTFENPIGRWLTNLSLTSKRREDTSLTDGFTRVDHRATYRYLTMLHEAGGVDQFAGFNMPIDITFGARSFAGVRQSAAIFQELWPQAEVTCLEGAGHLPILEATDLLQQIIFRDAARQGVYTQTTRETPCPRHSNNCAS